MKTPAEIKKELRNAKHVQCMDISDGENECVGTRYEQWFNGKYFYPDYCHECGRRMNAVSRKAQKEGETDA